jgi:hypothetical protein
MTALEIKANLYNYENPFFYNSFSTHPHSKRVPFTFEKVALNALINLKSKSSWAALASRNNPYGYPFSRLPSGTVAIG